GLVSSGVPRVSVVTGVPLMIGSAACSLPASSAPPQAVSPVNPSTTQIVPVDLNIFELPFRASPRAVPTARGKESKHVPSRRGAPIRDAIAARRLGCRDLGDHER